TQNSLLDLVNELYEVKGVRYYFLDEVHKYPRWQQEIKNIYDSFPDVYLVFSGSSSIDLVGGAYDLSRRAALYRLHGLSFREYLYFQGIADIAPVELHEILKTREVLEEKLAIVDTLRGHFKDYLSFGYYPFFLESRETYAQMLFQVIEKTVFEDIAHYYSLKTENLHCFKQILSYTATIPPGELNVNTISKNIRLDNKTVRAYLTILENTGMVALVKSRKSGSTELKQKEKIYLDNPNIYQAFNEQTGHSSNIGSVREIFFINMVRNSGHTVFHTSPGDFVIDNTIFEIGGRNKGMDQIRKSTKPAYLVKDDILYGSKNEIPLHLFGFLY
ncbi:MAG: ATP-binding protein, partial [Spirochaetia bacterium]